MKVLSKVTALVLSIFLFVISCDTTEPEEGESGMILFTSERSGNKQLYKMNPDGGNIEKITSGEYWNSFGLWSPNAQKIVCLTSEGASTLGNKMIVMNSDGSNRVLLGYGIRMIWSPDGEMIAFSSNTSGGGFTSKLYLINIDSTGIERITNENGENVLPGSWTKDGKTIYFASNRHNTSSLMPEIFSIDVETKEANRITYTTNGGSSQPSLSPDEKSIAFYSDRDSVMGIYSINTDGTNIKLVTSFPENESFTCPQWSPDGSKLIVTSNSTDYTSDGNLVRYLYKIDIATGNYERLLNNDPTVSSADWSLK